MLLIKKQDRYLCKIAILFGEKERFPLAIETSCCGARKSLQGAAAPYPAPFSTAATPFCSLHRPQDALANVPTGLSSRLSRTFVRERSELGIYLSLTEKYPPEGGCFSGGEREISSRYRTVHRTVLPTFADVRPRKIGARFKSLFDRKIPAGRRVFFWRRKRDLNSRDVLPPYSLSRGAPSPLGYFSVYSFQ